MVGGASDACPEEKKMFSEPFGDPIDRLVYDKASQTLLEAQNDPKMVSIAFLLLAGPKFGS